MKLKKYINKQKGLQIFYPSVWEVELSDNIVSVYKPNDGVGVIQYSSFVSKDSLDVKRQLISYLENKYSVSNVEVFDNYAYATFIDNQDILWRYWLFQKKEFIILATYNCAKEDAGKEDIEVDEIVFSSK